MNDVLPAHLTALSKFLSLILRHDPGTIGLQLDAQGWARIDELLDKAAAAGKAFSRTDLDTVVALNGKRRFTLSDDGERLRAAQGHSVAVDLGLQAAAPPALLYHGTATRFLDAIRREGLRPQSRQHVHLSTDVVTAVAVGQRHGTPVVLQLDTAALQAHGVRFFRADNGVWLADAVPAAFLAVLADADA